MIDRKIEEIFKKVFSLSNVSEINRKKFPLWDSLKHIELILELEDAFSIEVPNNLSTDILDILTCIKVVEKLVRT
jgi:acyl carrier protein